MKRRALPPDDRLDWRDPDMPVLRVVEYGTPGARPMLVLEEFTPEEEQAACQDALKRADRVAPSYDKDPSYNWNQRKNATT